MSNIQDHAGVGKPEANEDEAGVPLRRPDLGELLGRIFRRLQKPGITLPEVPGVPQYFVDRENPWQMMRKLNGKTEAVFLVNDKFQTEDKRS